VRKINTGVREKTESQTKNDLTGGGQTESKKKIPEEGKGGGFQGLRKSEPQKINQKKTKEEEE